MPTVDHLPELDIDFDGSVATTKEDETSYTELDPNIHYKPARWEYYIEETRDHIKTAQYYPGFNFVIKA